MSRSEVACFIGIGANLGDPAENVRLAIERLGRLPETRVTAQSGLFRTAPVDAGGDDYINAVAKIETKLPPQELLLALRAIEQDMGRERPYRNAPRTLDLDILLYGSETISSDSLTVPHPRMTERAFVLIPLLQIDPFINIPGKGPAHRFVSSVAGQTIQKI
ncbi:MAG TPA: 2-amino-4-hydroxy-6-hydroxymethyldihydropteridine diphosphokinase [Noviherbaspirillum sp.]